jgi:hypothetical protein
MGLPEESAFTTEKAASPPESVWFADAFFRENQAGGFHADLLDRFFAHFWGTSSGARPSQPARAPADGSQEGIEGDGPRLPPFYLAGALSPPGKPQDPVAAGYLYLCNYARHAIHTAEGRVGPLPDHDDIIQQICVEWLERAGPPNVAFPRLLDKAPAEMRLLRETVHRVIMRITYQHRKAGVNADLSGWPAPDRPLERAWLDFKSDCERGVGHLTLQEWHVLELRRQGHTFAEIGATIGMPRQRAWEICENVVARLQQIYGTAGGWEKPE